MGKEIKSNTELRELAQRAKKIRDKEYASRDRSLSFERRMRHVRRGRVADRVYLHINNERLK
jgi:hypothetical protein